MTIQSLALHMVEFIVVFGVAVPVGLLIGRRLHQKTQQRQLKISKNAVLKQEQKFIIDGKAYDLQSSVKEQRSNPAISPSKPIKEKTGSPKTRKWYNPFTWKKKKVVEVIEEDTAIAVPEETNNSVPKEALVKDVEPEQSKQESVPEERTQYNPKSIKQGYNPTKRIVVKGG